MLRRLNTIITFTRCFSTKPNIITIAKPTTININESKIKEKKDPIDIDKSIIMINDMASLEHEHNKKNDNNIPTIESIAIYDCE